VGLEDVGHLQQRELALGRGGEASANSPLMKFCSVGVAAVVLMERTLHPPYTRRAWMPDPLAAFDIALVRAGNPGPFTLSGTNTYVVGRDPAYVVDPGPRLAEHVAAIRAEVEARGGLGGIAVTHAHADHVEALPEFGGVAVAREGELGPLRAEPTPGHAPDHVAWLLDARVAFVGDAVLGEGSVFIAPDPGALKGYLAALERLRALELELLLPGHGPPVTDPRAKLDEYLAHRRDRERRLLEALADGRRSVDELLDAAWSDAPAHLRPAAALSLASHLDKLGEEGRLPEGVERPRR
jgi:glyoxylase-like metal-dependent hydrolase (beta-lactamase superfamily II)